ncbi:uncharacterized protein FRV6_16311 [Fusarium oxysporum]|uniref:Uncharacterized protein n=1 Tax=Fusarium oxysporum TaxID=5507 RepID=A0A2H3TU73_FUSOX|nr:uncharacterized protein FRV6_16311 [Fusarium oxysporum]
MRDMKDIACAFKGLNSEEVNDRETVCEYNKLLQLMEFDVKLAHSNMDRDTAFKYPWITTKNYEERLKILELSIQVFADTVVDAGSSKIACTPPFTKLAILFETIVIEYLELRHRRTAMHLDGAELLNSPYKAKEQYDEKNIRPPHSLLQRCKLDFLDREDGALHWSLGGVLAWRCYGEDSWMDRFGHVINEYE